MNSRPLAYHITFGTYGTRLHGDPRGTVCRMHNRHGEPVIGSDREWERVERVMLKFPPVVLSVEQRAFVEESVPGVCKRGGWELHACAGRGDHVHVMLSAQADGEAVRRWLKAWLGQALSTRWPLPQGATWWAEGGSVKWVWDPRYFEDVYRYVSGQKTIGR